MEDLPRSVALCRTKSDVPRIVKIIVQLIIDPEQEIDGVWNDEGVGMLEGRKEAINKNFD